MEPCAKLNGDVTVECAGCSAGYACHPAAPGFQFERGARTGASAPTSVSRQESEASPQSGQLPLSPSVSSDALFNFFDSSGFYNFSGWQGCLAGSAVPHAHDLLHKADDAIDMDCLRAAHVAYYGTDYVPVRTASSAGCEGRRGHLEAFGRQGQRVVPVPEVVGCMPASRFLNQHVREQVPLVMRGCAREQPAMRRWATDAMLRNIAGDWVDGRGVRFSDWLEEYNTTNAYYARMLDSRRFHNRDSPRTDMHSATVVRSLLDDLVLPTPLRSSTEAVSNRQVAFWMNSGRQTSQLHYDSHDAFLMQIDGEKELLLLDPADSHRVYLDFPASVHQFGLSPIDPAAVDMCTYPRAADVVLYNTTLSAGDAIYIPPIWWHLVASLPREPVVGRTVAATIQGFFLARDVPSAMSAAGLQWQIAQGVGCPVGLRTHESLARISDAAAPGDGGWRAAGCERNRVLRPSPPDEHVFASNGSAFSPPISDSPRAAAAADGGLLRAAADAADADTDADTDDADGGAMDATPSVGVRLPCIRAIDDHATFASASAVAFASLAFARVGNHTPCSTWVRLPSRSTTILFGDDGSALGLPSDARGSSVYAGPAATAPAAHVTLVCSSPFERLLRQVKDDAREWIRTGRAPNRAGSRRSASRQSHARGGSTDFFDSCTATAASDGAFGDGQTALPPLASACADSDTPACAASGVLEPGASSGASNAPEHPSDALEHADTGAAITEQLLRMLYGYWGDVVLVGADHG